MEISQVNISKTSADTKFKLAEDLIHLLNVRDKNSGMIEDWILFIATSNFKITAGEIYLAFKMAISREILDDKGNEIDIFPELSNNTTGKVISAYLKFKKESNQYQIAKDKLKALASPIKEITDEEKAEIRMTLLKNIYNDVSTTGFSSDAWLLFADLEEKGKVFKSNKEKKELYRQQLRIYEIEEKAYIRNRYPTSFAMSHVRELMMKISGKSTIESVANRCRSITVAEYLKDRVSTFEEFMNAIK